jgi:hypothetical protein
VIGERLASAREGRSAVLFVQGRAGFGKTRLLAEAAAMAGRAGIRAGFGAVQVSDQVVPMGGLVAALFDGREPLADPGARHRLHFLPEQRYWLLEELESLLEEAALASPILVCIDDMHWADGGSLAALRTLPPRLAHLPVMWLVSFREGQVRAELRAAIELATPMPPSPSPSPSLYWSTQAAASGPRWTGSRLPAGAGPR